MPNAPTRPRRTFDEAFKRDAVAWLLKGEKPLKQLAQDLGVRPWNLRDWLLSSRQAWPRPQMGHLARLLSRNATCFVLCDSPAFTAAGLAKLASFAPSHGETAR